MSIDLKEALMRAYVAGWQAGCSGITCDDGKRTVAADLAPQVAPDREMYEALKTIAVWEPTAMPHEPGGMSILEAIDTAANAIAKYEPPKPRIEAGVCPYCGSEDLDYGVVEMIDCGVTCPWTCEACGKKGIEEYETEFTGHTDREGSYIGKPGGAT